MGQRLELQALLKGFTPNVYHQAPESMSMKYPCIVYKRDNVKTIFADNAPFRRENRYQVTVIYSTPSSDIPDKVANLPLCSFDRSFVADNLNHEVFTLFF